jgi:hypothetical protein
MTSRDIASSGAEVGANAEFVDALGLSDTGVLVHLHHLPPPVAGYRTERVPG